MRITRVARRVALVGELEVAVALDGEQAVALHPGHGLRDGRTALVQPLGDPGAQRDDALLDQLVDGPEVHLGGVDQVAHPRHSPPSTPERTDPGGPRLAAVGRDELHAAVMWFRRDLRLADNPALLEAAGPTGGVLPLFVLDPALWGPAGLPRRAYLGASLRALDASLRRAEGAASRWCAATRSGGWCWPPGRSAPTGCTSPPTSGPTAPRATGGRARRWPSTTSSWSAPGRRTPWRRAG